MSSKRAVIFMISVLVIVACKKDDHAELHEAQLKPSVKIREQGGDFSIPSVAWDLLLVDSAEVAKEKERVKKTADEGTDFTASTFSYETVRVILEEKNQGVLKEKELRLDLPEGGGEIDLADWVTGQPGSFFVRFEIETDKEGVSDTKSLFYSRTRKRRVGNDFIGTGCQKILDLSKYLAKQSEKKGFTVNTTRNYHTTVLGGHFLFSWMKNGNRKVSRVTFIDSRNPALFCEDLK